MRWIKHAIVAGVSVTSLLTGSIPSQAQALGDQDSRIIPPTGVISPKSGDKPLTAADMPQSAADLAALVGFRVGQQRGPWALTNVTMSSLLAAGYNLTSTETMTTLSTGYSVGVTMDVVNANASASVAQSVYMAYYLQKYSSLYRCTEEGVGAQVVMCWLFAPVLGKVNGITQQDLPLNPLIGQWSGVTIDMAGKMVPVHLTFTDAAPGIPAALIADFPNLPPKTPVTYNVARGQVTVVPTGGGGQTQFEFNLQSDIRATFTMPYRGVTTLTKVSSGTSTTP